jgi:nicotinamidase-related amidase
MLSKENTVVVYVDIQGKLATLMYERERLFANLVRMAHAAKVMALPILWNEQLPDKLGTTIPELTEVLSDHKPLIKSCFSCCGNETFNDLLYETRRKQVLLMGIETHICVYQTAVDLLAKGFEVHVVIDAVSSRFDYNYHLGLQRMNEAGCRMTSVELSLFEMMGVAEGDTFRRIVKILK